MRPALALALAIACSENRAISPPVPPVVPVAPVPTDARAPDAGLSEVFDEALEVIERRVAQTAPKMKLTRDQGDAARRALLAVADREAVRALAAVMPRSTVELARAAAERGVALDEVDQIAAYLVRVTDTLAFERLATFDDNHSHVTGRDWQEIDYSGEGMTWQSQQAFWAPRGVTSFKHASSIHAYFIGAERLPHWARVYKPRGRMADVAAP